MTVGEALVSAPGTWSPRETDPSPRWCSIMAPKQMKVYPYHSHASVEDLWEEKYRWAHHYLMGMDTLPV